MHSSLAARVQKLVGSTTSGKGPWPAFHHIVSLLWWSEQGSCRCVRLAHFDFGMHSGARRGAHFVGAQRRVAVAQPRLRAVGSQNFRGSEDGYCAVLRRKLTCLTSPKKRSESAQGSWAAAYVPRSALLFWFRFDCERIANLALPILIFSCGRTRRWLLPLVFFFGSMCQIK